MSYIVNVSRDNSRMWQAFINAVQHVREKNRDLSAVELKEAVEKEFDIEFIDYDILKVTHPIRFNSENDFLLFMLKWA